MGCIPHNSWFSQFSFSACTLGMMSFAFSLDITAELAVFESNYPLKLGHLWSLEKRTHKQGWISSVLLETRKNRTWMLKISTHKCAHLLACYPPTGKPSEQVNISVMWCRSLNKLPIILLGTFSLGFFNSQRKNNTKNSTAASTWGKSFPFIL